MAFPANTTRYLLFLCNLIFLISAVAVAAVALLIALSLYKYDLFMVEKLTSPPIIVLIVCGIICLVTFFGCCGVIRENKCCLYTFSLFMIAIIVVEVLAGGYVFTSRAKISDTIQTNMKNSMNDYNVTNQTTITKSWDVLQHEFHCCGVKNYTDWYDVFHSEDLPHSCCAELPRDQTCRAKDIKNPVGCFSLFAQSVQTKILMLSVIVLSVGIVQLLCAVASGLLARHFKNQYEAV